jgi:hypothetical protein
MKRGSDDGCDACHEPGSAAQALEQPAGRILEAWWTFGWLALALATATATEHTFEQLARPTGVGEPFEQVELIAQGSNGLRIPGEVGGDTGNILG